MARQTPLSTGFSRQGFWSGLPHPPPGDLLDPGIEPMSPASPALADEFFTHCPNVMYISPQLTKEHIEKRKEEKELSNHEKTWRYLKRPYAT